MPADSQNQEGFISAGKDINVQEIMDSIKQRIDEKIKSGVLRQSEIDEIVEMELLPLPDFQEIPNVYQQHLYPDHQLNFFNPIPLEEEVVGGGGLRGTIKKVVFNIRGMMFPLIRFLVRPIVNKRIIHLHNENRREIARIMPIVTQSKEYILVLHNALNNMIVEFSKLKVEEEMLKTKIKVLEDKMEFLENRERAIEKKLFDQ